MSDSKGKKAERTHRYSHKAGDGAAGSRLRLAAVGMEAEFEVFVDGKAVRPEDVFGDPTSFLPGKPMHRAGKSYSLPNGGAVYFDTGVIEVATPVIEVSRGCMARAGRSLWEAVGHVRDGLDAWERRTGRSVRLAGFSTHYNVSFAPPDGGSPDATVERLALLLTHILPVPVMMLAANRRSTGIGVRPRGERIEVTADFTPSAALMVAAGTLIAGISRATMRWPDYSDEQLDLRGIPVIEGLEPGKHSSRDGWVARADSFPQNPFGTPPDEAVWPVREAYFRGGPARPLSLREVAHATARKFSRPIRTISDAFTARLISRVLSGAAPALLDLPDRPEAYDDVGRLCLWDDLFPEEILERSRYERVLIRAIAGVPLRLNGVDYLPAGLRGWSEIVFRGPDGLHTFPLDVLLDHLDDWERR